MKLGTMSLGALSVVLLEAAAAPAAPPLSSGLPIEALADISTLQRMREHNGNLEERVYISEYRRFDVKDPIKIQEIWDRYILPKIMEKYPNKIEYLKKAVISVQDRIYVTPLKPHADDREHQIIVNSVNQEMSYLGLAQYFPVPVRNVSDINTRLGGKKPIYIVSSINSEFKARIELEFTDGDSLEVTEPLPSDALDQGYSSKGKNLANIYRDVENGTISKPENQVIVVSGITDSPTDLPEMYAAFYCEPLHNELSNSTMKLVGALAKDKQGKITLDSSDLAIDIGIMTEEAVVHGVFCDWFSDVIAKEGLSMGLLPGYLAKLDRIKYYRGAKIIWQRSQRIGRKAVVDEYLSDPLQYWELIKGRFPELSGLAKQKMQ